VSGAKEFAFQQNFHSFSKILQNYLMAGDKGTNTAYFSVIQVAVEN